MKNNFRYNYTVILYNNIIFRFSFQIRCSDEHTPRSGSEKIHYYFFFVANSTLISSLSVTRFSLFFSSLLQIRQRAHSERHIGAPCRASLSRGLALVPLVNITPTKKKKLPPAGAAQRNSFRVSRSLAFSPFLSLSPFLFIPSFLHISRSRTLARLRSPFSFLYSEIYRNIGLELIQSFSLPYLSLL